MSQSDILNYLKKRKCWVIAKEIQKELEIGESAISSNLNCLLKSGEISRKEVPRDFKTNRGKMYQWKVN
jgi:DNA-binding MarR family transcriptional regulator